MELVEQVHAQTETGVWVVRSASATVYLLDTRGGQPQMMRLSSLESDSHGWWDNTWAPLVELLASPQLDLSTPAHDFVPGTTPAPWVLRLGSRHRWVADPGGDGDPSEWWWWSRMATSIELLDDETVAALLAKHGLQAEPDTGHP